MAQITSTGGLILTSITRMLIYLVYCPESGKGYVGQTTMPLKKRWAHHCYAAHSGSSNLIAKAIRKYGEAAFELSLLYKCNDLRELDVMERYFITKLDTLNPRGYNMIHGALKFAWRGRKRSSATIARMRTAAKKRIITPETRIKMKESLTGRKLTAEHKAKIGTGLRRNLSNNPKERERRAIQGIMNRWGYDKKTARNLWIN